MPTRYFKNSVNQNWDTLGNWWANAACDEGFSGTLTGVTVTVTDATVTCASTAGLVVGRPITGTGINTGSTVASITNSTEFELSLPAIANGSSNLACELHVIPVTGNDVVIATGNGTVEGTPSADVLGLVTVNGNSVLNVTLAAANFEFNDNSYTYYAASITGNCTFNDSSRANGYITGNCTFNDSSYNITAAITGNATFTATAFSTATIGFSNPQQGGVTGTVSFPNGATFTLAGSEQWSWNASAWTGTLAWEFNGYSYTYYGNITGDCTFNDTSYNNNNITGDCTFSDSSHNNGGLTGNGTFNDSSYTSDGTLTGNFTFNGTSYNASNITGNVTFSGSSYNAAYKTITGNVTFKGSSYNNGTVSGNGIIRQPATAFVAWRNYATSTYITGTLSLQFPEMDILGTGLL